MKLTEKQRVVLASCDLRPNADIAVLRRETGLREHTIRYAIRSLENRGIVSAIPFVNLQVLGYTNYNIFFSIGAVKRSSKDALVQALLAAPEVLWVGELGGEFQYGIGICAKSPIELFSFIEKLSTKFQKLFFDKELSFQRSVTAFPRKYLSSKKFSTKPLTASYRGEPIKTDDLDASILSAMASYGNLSHRQLALKLQIPLSTFELRLKKLEEKKAISGYLYTVNPGLYEMQQYNLLVYAKGLSVDFTQGLFRFCNAHKNVTYLIESLGAWDFEVVVDVTRSEDATEIVQQLYDEFGSSINTVRLLPKFRDLKTRWFPLIEEI